MVKFCTSYNFYSRSCTRCNLYKLFVQAATCTGFLYELQLVQYLNLYIKYIMQFHLTTGPHSVSHSTAGEVILGGYTLPNDTVIIPDIYSIHMNPDLWEDPEEFKPERFIDAEGKLSKPQHFIPFSIGKVLLLKSTLYTCQLFLLDSSNLLL